MALITDIQKQWKELLSDDANSYAVFNFQISLNIDAINMETRQLKVTELMDSLLYRGNAKQKLIMMNDGRH